MPGLDLVKYHKPLFQGLLLMTILPHRLAMSSKTTRSLLAPNVKDFYLHY